MTVGPIGRPLCHEGRRTAQSFNARSVFDMKSIWKRRPEEAIGGRRGSAKSHNRGEPEPGDLLSHPPALPIRNRYARQNPG